ncbi:hypothetical protein V2J09_003870 [Rumex salicifolius]
MWMQDYVTMASKVPPNSHIHFQAVYVDDMLITGNDKHEIQKLNAHLQSHFQLKRFGTDEPADIFIKILSIDQVKKHLFKLGVVNQFSHSSLEEEC